jgi:hypothetical protein
MAIVSLNEAARLVNKSTATISKQLENKKLKGVQQKNKNWEINTDDLFELYPQMESQKIERLEKELKESKNMILVLEEKLHNETSERKKLEILIEEANKKIDTNVKKVNIEFYDENHPKNIFLREHIDKFINSLEPFVSSYYIHISPLICWRLLANYIYEFDKFKLQKQQYNDECRHYPNSKSDFKDKQYEKFVYSIKNKDVSTFITEDKVPQYYQEINKTHEWITQHFRF